MGRPLTVTQPNVQTVARPTPQIVSTHPTLTLSWPRVDPAFGAARVQPKDHLRRRG